MVPLYVQGQGPIVFVPQLPTGWKGKILPGGKVFSYHGEMGQLVIQEYRRERWCLRYLVFQFLEKTVLHWTEESSLRLRFALEGGVRYKRNGKSFHLRAGMVNVVWAPGEESYATFSKGREYVLFHMLYAPDLVRQLLPQFPFKGVPSESMMMPVGKEWNDTIQSILDAPYDGDLLEFFMENKIREILFFLLLRPGFGIRYEGISEEEVAKIHEIDALILKDLKEWMGIPQLAKKANMTEFKLKHLFKRVIGMNLFERLKSARLERGRQLLLETNLQVKVIYRMLGYKSPSGFEDAFKEKYSLPPIQYRKRYQPKG